MLKRNVMAVSLSVGLAAFAGQASADIIGGGATLPAGVFNDIIDNYDYPTFNPYIGVGSSGGKRAFFNNDSSEFGYTGGETVHYAGSDSVASSAEIDGYAAGDAAQYGQLIQVPFAGTSVAVAYNHPGIPALTLTSSQVAKIFAGQITDWTDPELGLGLPSTPLQPITVVYRSDGSGTVEIFTRHLAAVEPSLFQASTNFQTARLVTGGISVGASGSSGVVSAMNSIPGAITFVSPDPTYIDVNDVDKVAAIVNTNDSTSYRPTQVDVQVTFDAATPPSTTNPVEWAPVFPDPSAGYPIAGFTFMLLSQCYSDTAIGADIGDFMLNHYTGAHDSYIADAHLVPLPSSWQNAVLNTYALFINDAIACADIPGR